MYRSPEVKPDPRRVLPAVDRLVEAVAAERSDLPTWAILEGVRRALVEARERLSESASAAASSDAPDAGAEASSEASRILTGLAGRSAFL